MTLTCNSRACLQQRMVYYIKSNGICHVALSIGSSRTLCNERLYYSDRLDGETSTGIAADCTTCKALALKT